MSSSLGVDCVAPATQHDRRTLRSISLAQRALRALSRLCNIGGGGGAGQGKAGERGRWGGDLRDSQWRAQRVLTGDEQGLIRLGQEQAGG